MLMLTDFQILCLYPSCVVSVLFLMRAFQIFALRDYLKENDTITKMELMRILNENAPKDESNRFQQLTITKKKLQEYFPTFYTRSQMEKVLFDLLAEWKKKQDEDG